MKAKVEIDALFLTINLKGTRPSKIPRASKKRESGSSKRGISDHKVCIISAVDEFDQMFFDVCGLGPESKDEIESCLSYFKVEEKPSLLVSDMKQGYRLIAERTNRVHDELKSTTYVSQKGNTLSTISQLHSEIRTLLRRYRGVSTKHLQGYLDFFILYKAMKYKHETNSQRSKDSLLTVLKEKFYIPSYKISKKEWPISLQQAYGDYHFGVFV